jgi:hypothetical protein
MKSLREEIYNRLTFLSDHIHEDDLKDCANDIVKKIEKIINKRINQIQIDNTWDNNNIPVSEFVDCDEFEEYAKLNELEDLKEEILK